MMLPFVAIMIPLFKMISSWNLVNSWIAFVLPSISTPFMIMMFRQAARSFPHDIIEAARLEGLSEIQIFFRMFVPVMKSTYGAAMTVTFMNAWNSYLLPKIVESLKHDNDSECCRNNHTQRRLNFLVDQIDRHVLRECRPIDHEEHGQQNEDKEHAERAELHFISPLWGRKSTFL